VRKIATVSTMNITTEHAISNVLRAAGFYGVLIQNHRSSRWRYPPLTVFLTGGRHSFTDFLVGRPVPRGGLARSNGRVKVRAAGRQEIARDMASEHGPGRIVDGMTQSPGFLAAIDSRTDEDVQRCEL